MMENNKKFNILITTGIYPPDIGGPAEYAKNLENVWIKSGHKVSVKTFRTERNLPTGFRHIWYFFKILPTVFSADFVLVLDTFSAAAPAILAAKIAGKKSVIRVGGDFLWEQYVQRTGEMIPLPEFYKGNFYAKFNFKERLIFKVTKWSLNNAAFLVWSTDWQKEIMVLPYGFDLKKCSIIENYYGPKFGNTNSSNKKFIWPVRSIKIKNSLNLLAAIDQAGKECKDIFLDNETVPFPKLIEKIKSGYAVILPSLSEVSPNLILQSIQCGKPFIVTKHTGLYEKLKKIGIFVDPLNREDIKQKIVWLCDDKNYDEQKKKIESFNFTHTWEDIASEFLRLCSAD
ncbi:MAG: hypothetical protein WCT19_00515 [Candidatus Paceibacterota bacterium]